MRTMNVLVINGPNMNMLGLRNPDVYGTQTLETLNSNINTFASGMKIICTFFQSNSEGEIVDKIQSVAKNYDGCIINAAAYSHYSIAIRDAIESVNKPFVEVHMSNIFAREDFRKTSVISPVCDGTISGFGADSYLLAVSAIRNILDREFSI